MKEHWKKIPGTIKHEISNYGNVRRSRIDIFGKHYINVKTYGKKIKINNKSFVIDELLKKLFETSVKKAERKISDVVAIYNVLKKEEEVVELLTQKKTLKDIKKITGLAMTDIKIIEEVMHWEPKPRVELGNIRPILGIDNYYINESKVVFKKRNKEYKEVKIDPHNKVRFYIKEIKGVKNYDVDKVYRRVFKEKFTKEALGLKKVPKLNMYINIKKEIYTLNKGDYIKCDKKGVLDCDTMFKQAFAREIYRGEIK
jgi:hypothetical protein